MPFLVWYVLPGLNLLTFGIAIPAIVLNLHGAAAVFSVDDLIAAAIMALVVGFIMDSVKLYRFSPGYGLQKQEFEARLGQALEINRTAVRNIFEIIRSDVRAQDPSASTIELDHSRWVMINHTSKTFFLAAGVWAGILMVHLVSPAPVTYFGLLTTMALAWKLPLDLAFAIVSIVIGWRMQSVAYQAANTSDMNYLIYVRKNSDRLKREITNYVTEGDPQAELAIGEGTESI